jgi:hypothetical protein
MYSREEILKVYNAGPEAVISLVQRLDAQLKHKGILTEQVTTPTTEVAGI